LIPGHAHSDIDQLFGEIKTKLRNNEYFTLEELQQQISSLPKMACEILNEVWDWKSYLPKYAEKPINLCSQAFSFLIRKFDGNSLPTLKYRPYSHLIMKEYQDGWMTSTSHPFGFDLLIDPLPLIGDEYHCLLVV
jgi:hypothetical protein